MNDLLDFMENNTISSEFKDLFLRIESSKSSFFITGRAGTGKSTFLKYFAKNTKKKIVVLAPTGIAAINVGGQTIHSFFKFPPRIITDLSIKKIENNKIYSKIDCIIIDEASMIRADIIDGIDKFMRLNGNDSKTPFGGVQIILFGDLYQLPPVVNKAEYVFSNYYNSPYFFDSKSIKKIQLKTIELKNVYRQNEEDFIKILDQIRTGKINDESLKLLNSRVLNSFSNNNIVLTCNNYHAKRINNYMIEKINEKNFILNGEVTGEFREFPVEKDLKLKIGAKVMITINHPDFAYFNGSIGVIHKIEDKLITVKLDSGFVGIEKYSYEKIKYDYDERKDKIISKIVGTFKQFPIKLAYALTIHKSQGQTFDEVIIDFGSGAFAHGQAYVALSRCKTLKGITLKRPIKHSDIIVDKRINDFLSQKKIINE